VVLFDLALLMSGVSVSLRRLADGWYVTLETPCGDQHGAFHELLWSPSEARGLAQRIADVVGDRFRGDQGGCSLTGFCEAGCVLSLSVPVARVLAGLLLSYADTADRPAEVLDTAAGVLSLLGERPGGVVSGGPAPQSPHRQALEDRQRDERLEVALSAGDGHVVELSVGPAFGAAPASRRTMGVDEARALLRRTNGHAAGVLAGDLTVEDRYERDLRRNYGRRGRWASAALRVFAEAAEIGLHREPVVRAVASDRGQDE